MGRASLEVIPFQVYRQRCRRRRQTQFQSEIEKLFSNYTEQLVRVEQLNAHRFKLIE